jgi:hypothetical protein
MTSGGAVHERMIAAPSLVAQLGQALREAGVVYCQWKGHFRRHRWASGEGDIDLLVDPASAPAFTAVLGRLGFKSALEPAEQQLPGVESFFGYDPRLARLLHVHAHYRLVVGRVWATHFRLPIEHALLASTVEREPFPTPEPPLELIVFVVRSLLGRSLRQELGSAGARWPEEIQDQLRYLMAQADRSAVHDLLGRHLACVEPALFDACLASLCPGSSPWHRARLRRRLAQRLRAFARRPPLADTIRRLTRRLVTLNGRLAAPPRGKRLARGGTTIALLGGDGSGKSTCTAALYRWLSPNIDTMTAHLGRPPRSLLTFAVGGLLKLRNALWAVARRGAPATGQPDGDPSVFPGYLALLRHVCTAHDRYQLYVKARRFASAGGLALTERYPIAQNQALVGPCVRGFVALAPNRRLATLLRTAEEWYYRQIVPPDHVIVLRVDPEVAVRRKTTEPPDYVRRRARIIWDVDWSATPARVVDGGRPLVEVLAELKTLVWSQL